MGEKVPSNEVTVESPLESCVRRAHTARQQMDAERAQLDALLQNLQSEEKELDLSDPEGDIFDETFRGRSTYLRR